MHDRHKLLHRGFQAPIFLFLSSRRAACIRKLPAYSPNSSTGNFDRWLIVISAALIYMPKTPHHGLASRRKSAMEYHIQKTFSNLRLLFDIIAMSGNDSTISLSFSSCDIQWCVDAGQIPQLCNGLPCSSLTIS